MKIFTHILVAVFFICMPLITYSLMGPNPHPASEPRAALSESIWVTAPYLRFFVQNTIFVIYFYVNYLLISPVFLFRKKNYLLHVVVNVATLLTIIYLIYQFHAGVDGFIGRRPMPFKQRLIDTMLYGLFIFTFSSGLFMLELNNTLYKARLESELLFLRSQINPHFLFNSFNNIYTLIMLKSDQAAEAMLKLSGLLRFVLYESGDKFILLEKDLKYIDDYISLQRLRLDENVEVNYSVKGSPDQLVIHPMLIIPFVENAFKHGVSYNEKCPINIEIVLKGKTLYLTVANGIFKNRNIKKEESGVGLNNVKRRLDILYPGAHELLQENSGTTYITRLKLELNAN